MKARTTFLLYFLLSFLILKSQTTIQSGDVYGDWYLSGSPYLIEGDIHLPSDQRLRIWPGVQVIFQGQYGFELEGKLDATGTALDSITFTINDTTGFSQDSYFGWNGLLFTGMNYGFSDSSIMAYCNIEYSGFNGITCINYSYLVIRNTEIRFNHSSGLVLFDFSDIMAESIVIRENKSGGLISFSSSPQVTNFLVKNNSGNGVSIKGNSSGNLFPFFSHGRIQNNTSLYNGGGIAIDIDAYVYIEDTKIIDNVAFNGGGIYCGMAQCDLNNVTIIGNSAQNGGGVYGGNYSYQTMSYCLIAKNLAYNSGGGTYINQGELNLYNCTLSENSSGNLGGGLVFNCNYAPQSTIRNSIVWNNNPGEIDVIGNGPIINFSDVNGGYSGIENIDDDPLFIDPLNNNFHLSWNSFPEGNGSKSPCIDAGDPDSSQDPDGTFRDMGAFYFDQGFLTTVNDTKSFNEVNIYPNPAQNFITISNVSGIDRIAVCNLTGEIIISLNVSSNIADIDISDLNSGVYIVQLFHMQDKLSTKKIIKN